MVLRRVLCAVSLTLVGLAGAAPATLATSRALPVEPTSSAGATTAPATFATTTSSTTASPTSTTPAGTVALTPPTPVVTSSQPTLVISGHGWGHGIGMSQWGAYGYAKHGWSYDRILAHYYRGTTLERRSGTTVRVLLLEGAKKVALDSESKWTVTDAKGTTIALPIGKLTVGPKLEVATRTLVSPLAFAPGSEPLAVGGKVYRGKLLVYSDGKKLQVVNVLDMEPYVKGVVGHEVPSTWPAAALQAQAVAARTYAFASLTTVVTARTFDLYADTRSQVYGGIEAEAPSVAAAVDATAGRVLLYGGQPITAYYSSSSGGRTVSAAEAFGTPVPYLVSVPDPYDTLSPNHDWGPEVLDAKKLAKALKLSGGLVDLRATVGPSGHVTTVTAVGPSGEVTTTGRDLRALLGLRSTWFTIGWLSLSPPATAAAYASPTTLTGVARGAGDVTLEVRTGSEWEAIGRVRPRADGSFGIVVRPETTTSYRLAAGDIRTSEISVPVEPVVDAAIVAGAVSGTVRPPLAGKAVQLQRQNGAGWATVATAKPDGNGAFAVAATVAPGSYRVRWAPGQGLSPGVSRSLQIS